MAWADHIAYQPIISANPEAIRPLGDFVLVRPLSDEDGGKLSGTKLAGLLDLSEFHMTQDYRYRWNRPKGNRLGEVLAIGPGDGVVCLECIDCGKLSFRLVYRDAVKIRGRCEHCAGRKRTLGDPAQTGARDPMLCAAGDIVIFPQVPANEIEINGEKLVFLHQEQHVLAVIEREAA